MYVSTSAFCSYVSGEEKGRRDGRNKKSHPWGFLLYEVPLNLCNPRWPFLPLIHWIICILPYPILSCITKYSPGSKNSTPQLSARSSGTRAASIPPHHQSQWLNTADAPKIWLLGLCQQQITPNRKYDFVTQYYEIVEINLSLYWCFMPCILQFLRTRPGSWVLEMGEGRRGCGVNVKMHQASEKLRT